MTPIADWLRDTRRRQVMPNGRPWTQEYLLDRMREAIGWAPAYPNYNRYEQGKSTPRPDTLARIVEFWRGQGEPEPDLTEQPAPLSLEERAVLAAERQADAMERQANSTSLLVTILSAWLPADARRALPEGVQSELARAMADMAHQFAAREETQSRPRVPAAR